jgi:hypothetical protein
MRKDTDVLITSLSGIVVYRGFVNAGIRIPLSPGVYVCTTSDVSEKIIIK